MRGAATTGSRGAVLALAAAAMAAVTLTACASGVAEVGSVANASSLRVGVKADQPGLGLRTPDGGFEGFDVDVARSIAERLGVPGDAVEFVGVTSDNREDVLRDNRVDLVLATYSITPERRTRVAFGGPYYVAHQDILVRRDDTSVHDVRDLAGKTLCQGRGSNSAARVTVERGVDARVVEEDDYSGCVPRLAEGEVDAISTDDLILAGYLKRNPSAFRLVNAPFTNEKYGVGVARDDLSGCEAVNKALTGMYQDGTAERLLRKWFGDTGLELVTSVPQFEGCV